MTDPALIELQRMRREFSALVASLSPWIGMEEMKARYGVIGKTLLEMERRKQIPERVNGRWLRSEVIAWESGGLSNRQRPM